MLCMCFDYPLPEYAEAYIIAADLELLLPCVTCYDCWDSPRQLQFSKLVI